MEETADGYERYVLAYFGLYQILHADNGQEFRIQIMRKLISDWDGDCKMKHGRPRRPVTQGLVEQSNETMAKMKAAMQAQTKIQNWHLLIQKIQFNLNTQSSTCK